MPTVTSGTIMGSIAFTMLVAFVITMLVISLRDNRKKRPSEGA